MKFPLVTRSHHESVVNLLTTNLEVRAELILEMKKVTATQRDEITALKLIVATGKCNDYTSLTPEKRKMPDPVLPSRSGWRTRAQMLSDTTIPVRDSAEALKLKVQKEGGTV